MKVIHKFGLAIIKDGCLLLCRPFAFQDLIMPGGTKEDHESFVDNLQREVKEELGDQSVLDVDSLTYLGHFSDRAAGRTNRIVEIDLYKGEISGLLKPSSEIKELVWYRPGYTKDILSPIIANKIVPFLVDNSYL